MSIIRNPVGKDFDIEILVVGAIVALLVVWVVLQVAPGVDLTGRQTLLTLLASLLGGAFIAWGTGRIWEIVLQEVALRKGFRGLEVGADTARKAIQRARATGKVSDNAPSADELVEYARLFKARRAAIGPIRDQMIKKLLADLKADA